MTSSANYLYGKSPFRHRMEQATNENQSQWLWLSVPFYNMTMILAKFSALTLYARLFRPRRFLLILQLNGLPRYRRSVDEPERLSLLHSSPRLLESIGRGSRLKLSTCQPCLVHQCGTPDFYRSGNIGSAPVAIMEVTATEKTEVGDPGGFRSWNLVSRSNIVCG